MSGFVQIKTIGNFVVKQPKSEDECYEEDILTKNEDFCKKKLYKKERPLDDTKRRKAKRALKRSFED